MRKRAASTCAQEEQAAKRPRAPEVEHALSPSQRRVLEEALSGNSFFFTGAAGTGKSYLLGHIRRALNAKYGEDCVFVTASTGIAACNIGGTTLHSFAGVGLGEGNVADLLEELEKPRPWTRAARVRWKRASALIIDECSMLVPELFENLDKVGSYVRGVPNKPFGGIQVILCGDFYQLPPVNKDRAKKETSFIFETQTWARLVGERVFVLGDIFRQTEPEFKAMLADFRCGVIGPESMATFQTRRNLTEAAEALPEGTVKLYSTRKEVDIVNFCEMDKLPGEAKIFTAVDKGDSNVVKKMEDHWMTPKTLILKVGASVMLVNNVSFELGLVNGKTGKVVSFQDKSGEPVVQFNNGGGVHSIARATWEIKSGKEVIMTHSQIPLILAYAVTIHKSQGMSIENVEINTARIFETAQLYTALSRGISLQGVFIRGPLPKAALIKPNDKVAAWWNEKVLPPPPPPL